MEKTITSEQRKMLSKLYEKQIDAKIQEKKVIARKKRDELIKNIIASEAQDLTKMVNKYNSLNEQADDLEKEIADICSKQGVYFDFYSYQSDHQLQVENRHPLLVKADKKNDEQEQKMNEVKTKILVDIWGLTGDYNAVCDKIDKELAVLDRA